MEEAWRAPPRAAVCTIWPLSGFLSCPVAPHLASLSQPDSLPARDVCGWGSLYLPRWPARSCRLAPAFGPLALTSPCGDVSGAQQALAHCVCPLGGEVGCQPSQQLVRRTGLPLSGARKRCVQRAGPSFSESLWRAECQHRLF